MHQLCSRLIFLSRRLAPRKCSKAEQKCRYNKRTAFTKHCNFVPISQAGFVPMCSCFGTLYGRRNAGRQLQVKANNPPGVLQYVHRCCSICDIKKRGGMANRFSSIQKNPLGFQFAPLSSINILEWKKTESQFSGNSEGDKLFPNKKVKQL